MPILLSEIQIKGLFLYKQVTILFGKNKYMICFETWTWTIHVMKFIFEKYFVEKKIILMKACIRCRSLQLYVSSFVMSYANLYFFKTDLHSYLYKIIELVTNISQYFEEL